MASILLIDDDEHYRSALKGLFQSADHSVAEVANGLVAQSIMTEKSFDVVISDIQMPEMDGVQFLSWSKSQFPKTPVILMTGFSEILESTHAAKLGADGFLPKPFKFEEANRLVAELASGIRKSNEVDVDHLYSKVPIDNFASGSRIHFNIFHRISRTKYVKIAYQGENISEARLATYKQKGLEHLYLAKEDYAQYVGFRLPPTYANPSVDLLKRKNDFANLTNGIIKKELFLTGLAKEHFEPAQKITEATLELALEHEQVFPLLESLHKHGDFLYAHSLGVSLYSVMMARQMGWNWTPALFKVSLSGLLHDIGFKELSSDAIKVSQYAESLEERKLFESHTSRGMEILNELQGVPEDIILVAYQHHEDSFGQGFPQKLQRVRIHPISRVVNLADSFCELVLPWPGAKTLRVADAIHALRIEKSSFDRECFTALESILDPHLRSATAL